MDAHRTGGKGAQLLMAATTHLSPETLLAGERVRDALSLFFTPKAKLRLETQVFSPHPAHGIPTKPTASLSFSVLCSQLAPISGI